MLGTPTLKKREVEMLSPHQKCYWSSGEIFGHERLWQCQFIHSFFFFEFCSDVCCLWGTLEVFGGT
jgi:hypothetical protein